MYYAILDAKRREILPLCQHFAKDFYLAGGTALALQLGHRRSIDFDFFTRKKFLPDVLLKKIKTTFKPYSPVAVQMEKNTLSVIVNDVRMSFLYYPYPLLEKVHGEPYLRLASVPDIGCMKLSAIVSRATSKDYVDLYYILQQVSLLSLLRGVHKKFPELDENLVLKSLLYFKDVQEEKIYFTKHKKRSLAAIERFIKNAVKEYLNSQLLTA
jgi:predicted nucleotidyltransferase component of viral defense system